tara:strand:+ start:436 stop:597 length:162 start_codon:yes stop_codon:yes gene_type:complete
MDSLKDTHRYAFELVRASRIMPIYLAEKQPHIKVIRTKYYNTVLKNRTNKNIT